MFNSGIESPAVAFVVNSTRVRDLSGFRRRCQRAAAARGWEPFFLETTLADRGLGLTRDAVMARARLVFSAGGDGTVRACAQALAGTGVPLAILPMGTANLAARALGVPSRLGAALATGFGGGGGAGPGGGEAKAKPGEVFHLGQDFAYRDPNRSKGLFTLGGKTQT